MEAVGDVYTIPQEHLDFCATIGQIARERIAPRSSEIDEKAEYPWDVRRLLAEQDILGLPFPIEYGGTGTGTLMLNMAVEEIAKVDAACRDGRSAPPAAPCGPAVSPPPAAPRGPAMNRRIMRPSFHAPIKLI
jgi:alkylation response protein AidB-like acyl-CoA dehydrogenase